MGEGDVFDYITASVHRDESSGKTAVVLTLSIRENGFVVIVCTPRYKSRSDSREGGVGYEGDIMTAEVMSSNNHRKFIPILRKGAWSGAAPSWLLGKYYINLTGDPYSERDYEDLVRTLLSRLHNSWLGQRMI